MKFKCEYNGKQVEFNPAQYILYGDCSQIYLFEEYVKDVVEIDHKNQPEDTKKIIQEIVDLYFECEKACDELFTEIDTFIKERFENIPFEIRPPTLLDQISTDLNYYIQLFFADRFTYLELYPPNAIFVLKECRLLREKLGLSFILPRIYNDYWHVTTDLEENITKRLEIYKKLRELPE